MACAEYVFRPVLCISLEARGVVALCCISGFVDVVDCAMYAYRLVVCCVCLSDRGMLRPV